MRASDVCYLAPKDWVLIFARAQNRRSDAAVFPQALVYPKELLYRTHFYDSMVFWSMFWCLCVRHFYGRHGWRSWL